MQWRAFALCRAEQAGGWPARIRPSRRAGPAQPRHLQQLGRRALEYASAGRGAAGDRVVQSARSRANRLRGSGIRVHRSRRSIAARRGEYRRIGRPGRPARRDVRSAEIRAAIQRPPDIGFGRKRYQQSSGNGGFREQQAAGISDRPVAEFAGGPHCSAATVRRPRLDGRGAPRLCEPIACLHARDATYLQIIRAEGYLFAGDHEQGHRECARRAGRSASCRARHEYASFHRHHRSARACVGRRQKTKQRKS